VSSTVAASERGPRASSSPSPASAAPPAAPATNATAVSASAARGRSVPRRSRSLQGRRADVVVGSARTCFINAVFSDGGAANCWTERGSASAATCSRSTSSWQTWQVAR
jgi:hypothetical protein